MPGVRTCRGISGRYGGKILRKGHCFRVQGGLGSREFGFREYGLRV